MSYTSCDKCGTVMQVRQKLCDACDDVLNKTNNADLLDALKALVSELRSTRWTSTPLLGQARQRRIELLDKARAAIKKGTNEND